VQGLGDDGAASREAQWELRDRDPRRRQGRTAGHQGVPVWLPAHGDPPTSHEPPHGPPQPGKQEGTDACSGSSSERATSRHSSSR